MERLNNNLQGILGRVSTSRRYQNEQRPTPTNTPSLEQRAQPVQPVNPRHPVSGQRTRLAASNFDSSEQQHYTRIHSPRRTQNFSVQEEASTHADNRIQRSAANPPPAPLTRAQPSEPTRPNRMSRPAIIDEEEEYGLPPVREYTPRSYGAAPHTDDSGQALHADAMSWQEDLDDLPGMEDGDWQVMINGAPTAPYQHSEAITNEPITRAPQQYTSQRMSTPARKPAYQDADTIIKHQQTRYAVQPGTTQVQEVRNATDAPYNQTQRAQRAYDAPAHVALPPPITPVPSSRQAQVVRHAPQHTPQRNTQPLNGRAVPEPRREREYQERSPRMQEVPRQPRPVPAVREVVLPYIPTTPPPVNQKSVCPRCKGAGYLRANVQFGHPNFGKPIPCECKEAERKDKRRQQLREMSNLDAFRDRVFGTFNPRVPGVQEAYEVAHDYAQEPEGWLLLVGPNGCGKTHLAAAIANQCLEDGAVVLFAVVPDLLDHLRAAFAPTSNEVFDQLFSKMREAEVLILDDLGSQQSSPWANEKLFQLLNYRYNMGMPTVVTANPKGIQGIDERIRSRLMDVSLVAQVNFERARDYRPHHPRRD